MHEASDACLIFPAVDPDAKEQQQQQLQRIYISRAVLSLHSSFFMELFKHHQQKEKEKEKETQQQANDERQVEEIELNVTQTAGISIETLMQVLRFCYTKQLDVNLVNYQEKEGDEDEDEEKKQKMMIMEMYGIAELWNITALKTACDEVFVRMILKEKNKKKKKKKNEKEKVKKEKENEIMDTVMNEGNKALILGQKRMVEIASSKEDKGNKKYYCLYCLCC